MVRFFQPTPREGCSFLTGQAQSAVFLPPRVWEAGAGAAHCVSLAPASCAGPCAGVWPVADRPCQAAWKGLASPPPTLICLSSVIKDQPPPTRRPCLVRAGQGGNPGEGQLVPSGKRRQTPLSPIPGCSERAGSEQRPEGSVLYQLGCSPVPPCWAPPKVHRWQSLVRDAPFRPDWARHESIKGCYKEEGAKWFSLTSENRTLFPMSNRNLP